MAVELAEPRWMRRSLSDRARGLFEKKGSLTPASSPACALIQR